MFVYCTCGRPWLSITPPPPCPEHGTARSGWSYSGGLRCRGRHCAHTQECYRSVWAVTFNG